jgi:hypothetical protein
MKTRILILAVALAVMGRAAVVEIELITGSKFKGEVKKVTPELVVVQTAIGELKLTRAMLSPHCIASLRATATSGPATKSKPTLGVQVIYRTKKTDTETQHTRYIHQEVTRTVAILDIKFSYVPTTGSVPVRIEYEFLGEARGAARGTAVKIDGGVKLVDVAHGKTESIQIVSREITHGEGRQLREVGAQFTGYRIKVYAGGHLILEESK